jgi:hypothetical protein
MFRACSLVLFNTIAEIFADIHHFLLLPLLIRMISFTFDLFRFVRSANVDRLLCCTFFSSLNFRVITCEATLSIVKDNSYTRKMYVINIFRCISDRWTIVNCCYSNKWWLNVMTQFDLNCLSNWLHTKLIWIW